MKTWSLALVATAALSAAAGALLARAQSGEPPVIGPTAKPELTVSTEKQAEKPADPATPSIPVKTVYTDCHDELTQAADEIEWWREQLAAAGTASSPPSADPAGAGASSSPPDPTGTPTPPTPAITNGPNALPTATALMAAADPRLAAVPLVGQPADGPIPIPSPLGVLDRPRLKQVAALVKDMKPRDAAEVVAGLDDNLAVGLLARMPPKSASAITAALPPEHAARLLTQLSVLPIPTEPEE